MAKHVLITGASRGIGAATARVFAAEGWNVALALAAELSAGGVEAVALEGDVSDPDQASALVEAAASMGPLDALVCCAGIALPQQLLTDTTDQQWRRVMGVDENHIPVKIRAKLKIGAAEVYYKDSYNLRAPLTCRIVVQKK